MMVIEQRVIQYRMANYSNFYNIKHYKLNIINRFGNKPTIYEKLFSLVNIKHILILLLNKLQD